MTIYIYSYSKYGAARAAPAVRLTPPMYEVRETGRQLRQQWNIFQGFRGGPKHQWAHDRLRP